MSNALVLLLAKEIVVLYHGLEVAMAAEERFKQVFQKGENPVDIETIEIKLEYFYLSELVVKNNLVKSKNEFKRLVTQGGVKVNGEKLMKIEGFTITSEIVIQIGKKKFLKVILI